MLSSLGGNIRVDNNIELVDIINPPSTEDITYYWAGNCNLNYIDFYPLSGASISDIQLQDNTMVVGDVNHILVDFYTLNNTYFQPGWSGVTLDISGTNAAPDGASGGYDGEGARSRLINDYGWTITSS